MKLYLQQALATAPDVPRMRAVHVLMAVKARRFPLYQTAMTSAWPTRVSAAEEAALPYVIMLLDLDRDLWNTLPEHEQLRLTTFLHQASASQSEALLTALRIPMLHDTARTRLAALPADELQPILLAHLQRDLALLAVERLETVDSFKAAGQFLEVIYAALQLLSEAELHRVLVAARTNSQIHSASFVTPQRLRQLLSSTATTYPGLAPEWVAFVEEHSSFVALKNDLRTLGWLPAEEPEVQENL